MIILGCGHGVMAQSKTTQNAAMLKVLRSKLKLKEQSKEVLLKNAEKFADCFTKELSEN
jgi:hypothetical protein